MQVVSVASRLTSLLQGPVLIIARQHLAHKFRIRGQRVSSVAAIHGHFRPQGIHFFFTVNRYSNSYNPLPPSAVFSLPQPPPPLSSEWRMTTSFSMPLLHLDERHILSLMMSWETMHISTFLGCCPCWSSGSAVVRWRWTQRQVYWRYTLRCWGERNVLKILSLFPCSFLRCTTEWCSGQTQTGTSLSKEVIAGCVLNENCTVFVGKKELI